MKPTKPNNMNDQFKKYRRKQIAELRPVTAEEAHSRTLASNISLSAADKENGSPQLGDMIARNPANHNDQWLVAEKYFLENFEPAIDYEALKKVEEDIKNDERTNHHRNY